MSQERDGLAGEMRQHFAMFDKRTPPGLGLIADLFGYAERVAELEADLRTERAARQKAEARVEELEANAGGMDALADAITDIAEGVDLAEVERLQARVEELEAALRKNREDAAAIRVETAAIRKTLAAQTEREE